MLPLLNLFLLKRFVWPLSKWAPLEHLGLMASLVFFFQKHCDVVGDDIIEAVQSFFLNGFLTRELNHTNVTLIPKVNFPKSMSQFQPISFCRFVASYFSEASGLSINEHKSSLYFFANITTELKEEVKGILGMPERDLKAKYLGLPIE